MKTIAFAKFSTHQTTDPGVISAPRATKQHTSELSRKLIDPKQEKTCNLLRKRNTTGTPNAPEIYENPSMDPKVFPFASPWIPPSSTW
jgi:hypothetical protein